MVHSAGCLLKCARGKARDRHAFFFSPRPLRTSVHLHQPPLKLQRTTRCASTSAPAETATHNSPGEARRSDCVRPNGTRPAHAPFDQKGHATSNRRDTRPIKLPHLLRAHLAWHPYYDPTVPWCTAPPSRRLATSPAGSPAGSPARAGTRHWKRH